MYIIYHSKHILHIQALPWQNFVLPHQMSLKEPYFDEWTRVTKEMKMWMKVIRIKWWAERNWKWLNDEWKVIHFLTERNRQKILQSINNIYLFVSTNLHSFPWILWQNLFHLQDCNQYNRVKSMRTLISSLGINGLFIPKWLESYLLVIKCLRSRIFFPKMTWLRFTHFGETYDKMCS